MGTRRLAPTTAGTAAPKQPGHAPHLAIVGPTASGKSAAAMEVARRLGDVEIVSVDSMQVYRRMDIGTAKPSAAEQAEIPHHLIDVAEPHEDYTVVRFQGDARAAITAIEGRGHRALLVGGTGLHLRAVVDGLEIPGQWPQVKAQLQMEAEAEGADGTARLYRRLQELDPLAASRIEPANLRRTVRALEVTIGSGRPFSSFGPGLGEYGPTPFRMFGLRVDRAALDHRIARRLADQMAAGFPDEVRALAAEPRGLSRTAGQALGYRELLGHVAGHTTLEEAQAEAERRTRAFARRQQAWFRRDPRVQWFDVDPTAPPGNTVEVVDALLGDLALHG